jgi:hypothetical protein
MHRHLELLLASLALGVTSSAALAGSGPFLPETGWAVIVIVVAAVAFFLGRRMR